MAVQVLDCTLRDGGYVNNWEFGKQAIGSILEKLNGAGIDIVECGFLTSAPRGEDCSLFSDPRQIEPLLPQRGRQAMFVAMRTRNGPSAGQERSSSGDIGCFCSR